MEIRLSWRIYKQDIKKERIMPKAPDQLPVKILAIGAGGLQRALTHEFVHQLNQRGIYHGAVSYTHLTLPTSDLV